MTRGGTCGQPYPELLGNHLGTFLPGVPQTGSAIGSNRFPGSGYLYPEPEPRTSTHEEGEACGQLDRYDGTCSGADLVPTSMPSSAPQRGHLPAMRDPQVGMGTRHRTVRSGRLVSCPDSHPVGLLRRSGARQARHRQKGVRRALFGEPSDRSGRAPDLERMFDWLSRKLIRFRWDSYNTSAFAPRPGRYPRSV